MTKKKAAPSGRPGAASTTSDNTKSSRCLCCGKPANPDIRAGYISSRLTPEGKHRIVRYPICMTCWMHCRNQTRYAKRHLQPMIESALECFVDVALFPPGDES